jgi:hypothetical protein
MVVKVTPVSEFGTFVTSPLYLLCYRVHASPFDARAGFVCCAIVSMPLHLIHVPEFGLFAVGDWRYPMKLLSSTRER